MPKKRRKGARKLPGRSSNEPEVHQSAAAASTTNEQKDNDFNELLCQELSINESTAAEEEAEVTIEDQTGLSTRDEPRGDQIEDSENRELELLQSRMSGIKTKGKSNQEIQDMLSYARANEKPTAKPSTRGSAGEKIALIANCFKLELKSNIPVCMYDIRNYRSNPTEKLRWREVRRREENQLILREMAAKYPEAFGQNNTFQSRVAYDLRNTAFTHPGLPMRGDIARNDEGDYVFEIHGALFDFDYSPSLAGAIPPKYPYYRTIVKNVENLVLGTEHMKKDYNSHWFHRCRKQLQSTNYSDNFVSSGRSFFEPTLSVDMGGGREILRGNYTAPCVADGWVTLLNYDVIHSAFFKTRDPEPQSGIYFACEVLGMQFDKQPVDVPPTELSQAQCRILQKVCEGLEFKTTHRAVQRFKCEAIDRNKTAISHTIHVDGVEQTIAQFFQTKYGVTLRYPRWPLMLKRGGHQKSYFPIEVCNMADKQRVPNRKLTPQDQQKMIRRGGLLPPDRLALCVEGVRKVFESSPIMQRMSMSVAMVPMKVPGRVLPAPIIQFNENQTNHKKNVQNGVFNMGSNRLYGASKNTTHALVLYICTPGHDVSEQQCRARGCRFYFELQKHAGTLGLALPDARDLVVERAYETIDVRLLSNREPERSIKSVLTQYVNSLAQNQRADSKCLVIGVLPMENSLTYGMFKQAASDCSLDPGDSGNRIVLFAQGIQSKKLIEVNEEPRRGAPLLQHLCYKINPKLGGTNFKLADDPLALTANLRIINDYLNTNRKQNIFIGVDVSHDTSGHNPSIVGIASSLDFLPQKYFPQHFLLPPRTEIVPHEELIKAIMQCLKQFFLATKVKPYGIFYYRDGVSESQFLEVQYKEFCAIQMACRKMEADYKPKITFTVVQKGHHTRLFHENPPLTDHNGNRAREPILNVPSGTTVDSTITHPTEFDFYQASHQGSKGTSKPCRYNVLQDNRGISFDQITLLSHYMCHSFMRCTRAVSLPPPVYYAHLIAKNAKHRLEAALAQTGAGQSTSTSDTGHDEIDAERLMQMETLIHLSPSIAQSMYFL